MKFFQKHKNKLSVLCLVAVLLSCFMGFSFSSSAEVVNDVTELTVPDVYFQVNRDFSDLSIIYHLSNVSDAWVFDTDLPYTEPAPIFHRLTFSIPQDYTVPSYSGRALSLSFNLDFVVSDHGYLSLVPDNVDLSDSAIFTGCFASVYFSDGSEVTLLYDSFILRDDELGEIVDPSSDAYWETRKIDSPLDFSIYALFDFTPYVGKTITQTYITFPYPFGSIYYSNDDLTSYLTVRDVSANIDFAYSPFQDVVQDDLTDIKGSLSGVNNRLDSISSSMNTIDQDINRVNQTVSDLRDDLTQGDPDIESSNSDILSSITDVRDEVQSMESDVDGIISDIHSAGIDIDPFNKPDIPILSDFWARDFIWELWGFFKSQSILYTFIHVGMLLCLVCFVLRR